MRARYLVMTWVAIFAQSAISQDSGTLTAVSYNVAALPPVIACCDPGDNLPEVAIRVALEDFDIVGYQEAFVHSDNNGFTGVGTDYYDELMGPGTPVDYQFPAADSPTLSSGGVASGLGRIARFPFDESGSDLACEDSSNDPMRFCRQRWTMLADEDSLSDKGYSFARHEPSPGVYLDVYNWHAQSGSQFASERRDNTDQLIAEINARSQGQAVIVMGDTNSTYDRVNDNIRNMLTDTASGPDSALTDVWLELVRGQSGIPVQGSTPLFPCDEPGPAEMPRAEWGGANCEWRDKIFYRSSATLTLTAAQYFVLTDFTNLQSDDLSDHYPTGAVFDFQVITDVILITGFELPAD